MRTPMVFLRILSVVARTRILNTKVQMGSMMVHWGQKYITRAAVKTPGIGT